MIYLHAPIMCYIVEGPDEGTANDISIWKTLMSAPEDDEGVISNTYAYTAGSATAINEGVADVGPVSGVYDPEWDAFMAGELI
jgi:hypothetical protein